MSNSFFQFKQFTIQQDKCAMKVSTDACIFGAWITVPTNAKNCLDVGTGSGLLSLMVAQKRSDIHIDTVEINKDAAMQATENIGKSKFAQQIKVHHADIKTFDNGIQYDFIFTNPPFFENDLASPSSAINLAKHSSELSLQDLMQNCKRLLNTNGQAAVIVPTHRSADLQKYALQQGLYLHQTLHIQHHVGKPFTKEIHIYSILRIDLNSMYFTIKNADNINSEMMIDLMIDFYL